MDKREPADFQLLFESLPGLYMVLRPDLTIAAATQAHATATKTVLKDIIGKSLFDVYPENPDDPAAAGSGSLRESLLRVLREKKPDTMAILKYDVRRPDSEGGGFEEKYWTPVNSPIFAADGSVAYILNRVEDVSDYMRMKQRGTEQERRVGEMEKQVLLRARELEAANSKLQRLDTMRSRFFANVSHELRTPLTLILAPIRRILADGKTDPALAAELHGVANNARVLLKHVNDLLEVAKLEAERMELRYSEFDLAEHVRMVASNFASFAQDKGYVFNVAAPDSLRVQADPEKVQRILVNLLSNAFKYTPKGGRVRCELKEFRQGGPDKSTALITISDSGPGIPVGLRAAIFDRFFRVEKNAARTTPGTGLGLSIVQELTQLHSGSVSVAGEPGEGAVFKVELPLLAPVGTEIRLDDTGRGDEEEADLFSLLTGSDDDAPDAAPTSAVAGDPDQALLLVVEDNAEMRMLLTRTLAGKFRLVTARNGSEGFAAAQRAHPDLILSDLMMPETNGAELLRMIRELPRFDDTPFILLTAKADEESRVALLQAGAQDYIQKPFVAEEVLARIGNLVAMKRAREALRKAKDAAEAANQELDAFAHSVSHDLRTPLRHVQGFTELLKDRIASGADETALGHIEDVLQACRKMSNLIDDVLSFSRMSRSELRRSPVDMKALAEEAKRELAPEAAGREVAWSIADLPSVEGDRAMLKQVVLNLFSNALKFTRQRAPAAIEMGSRPDEGGITFFVKDNGAGFEMRYAEKLFGVFQRLHSPTEFEGTGIGLANVRRIVNRHGGRAWAEGEAERGATFFFRLPATQA